MDRIIGVLLLGVLLLGLGCGFKASVMGYEAKWVIGNASVDCSYDENGYPTGGEGCVAGGELSQQAADAYEHRTSEYTERTAEREETERVEALEGGD